MIKYRMSSNNSQKSRKQTNLSIISTKSFLSTTVKTENTLPNFNTSYQVRTKKSLVKYVSSSIKMSQPQSILEAQQIKHSTKIILKSTIQEYKKYISYLSYKKQEQDDIYLTCKKLFSFIGQDFKTVDTFITIIYQQCKDYSPILGMIFGFVVAIIYESYGHQKSSLRLYQQLCFQANKLQQFKCKMSIYYRIGLIYNRMNRYQEQLSYGKKLLKSSWYFSDNEYELMAYYLLGRAYLGLQDLEMSYIFLNKHQSGTIQPNDSIKQIGMQQVAISNRSVNLTNRNRSPSQDEFNLEMFREKIVRKYIKMKMVGGKLQFKTQSSECDICAMYGKNCERIQLLDEHPYKKDIIVKGNSRNRDYIGYYDSDQIQQMYLPQSTLPILKEILLIFITQIQ